jgi:hypothetical protein
LKRPAAAADPKTQTAKLQKTLNFLMGSQAKTATLPGLHENQPHYPRLIGPPRSRSRQRTCQSPNPGYRHDFHNLHRPGGGTRARQGSITAIDATSVTVTTTQKTLLLEITPKTKFKKDKAVAGIGDFAVGDLVTGSYSVDPTGALTANTLHKKTPKMPHVTTTPAMSATPAAPATPATPAAQ